MLLHELTHAFHFRDIKRIDSIVKPVYAKALALGLYEEVPYILGGLKRHYALTDYKEYLAEMAEAYFSSGRFRNDYFPFTHFELLDFDMEAFEMV